MSDGKQLTLDCSCDKVPCADSPLPDPLTPHHQQVEVGMKESLVGLQIEVKSPAIEKLVLVYGWTSPVWAAA